VRYAPELPTTQQLHNARVWTLENELAVEQQRKRIGNAVLYGFFGGAGGCSENGFEPIVSREGRTLREVQDEADEDVATAERKNVWKPRTNIHDWHGQETTDPVGAYNTIANQSAEHANVIMEVAHRYHLERYGRHLSAAWFGSRNEDDDFMDWVALHYPSLTLLAKNDLSGEFDTAMARVERLNALRGENFDDPAPVVLMYRGGENYTSPEDWEEQRNAALEAAGGIMIDDLAHGTEMAHDPSGNFKKSIQGQMDATEHLVDLWKRGHASTGTLMEASDAPSDTDPNEPFDFAIRSIKRLIVIKNELSVPVHARIRRDDELRSIGYNNL
jgi:hypothetical protein